MRQFSLSVLNCVLTPLAGHPPFFADSLEKLTEKVLQGDYPAIRVPGEQAVSTTQLYAAVTTTGKCNYTTGKCIMTWM